MVRAAGGQRVRKRPIVSIAASLVVTASIMAAAGGASTGASAGRGSGIQWSPCRERTGFPFECARVPVPLDYSNPQAGTISLALLRLPASDPTHRIGSLFVNPGGPGGSGVDFVRFAGPYLYGGAIQSRFDIVGFDPRGIDRSTPLRCFDSPDQWGPAFTHYAFPRIRRQERRWRQADLYLAGACDARGNPIMNHMATADVARDLDRLRAAVGDDALSYMGVSYGSFLGVTYANMFPDRVRAVIVDGVLDPIAWATGVEGEGGSVPFSTRVRSDMGGQATLDEFFRMCDARRSNCAFAPHSADRFAQLADTLRHGAVTVVDPHGNEFHFMYQDLIATTLGALYDSSVWRRLARFLADVDAQVPPRQLGRSLSALHRAEGFTAGWGKDRYRNFVESLPGVACSDSDNPSSYRAWSDQGAISDERFGYFGRYWTWVSEHLRPMARVRPRPLCGSVRRYHRESAARDREPVRSGDPVPGRTDRPPSDAELGAAHRPRMGAYLPLPLPLRRPNLDRLPGLRRHPGAGQDLPAGQRALQTGVRGGGRGARPARTDRPEPGASVPSGSRRRLVGEAGGAPSAASWWSPSAVAKRTRDSVTLPRTRVPPRLATTSRRVSAVSTRRCGELVAADTHHDGSSVRSGRFAARSLPFRQPSRWPPQTSPDVPVLSLWRRADSNRRPPACKAGALPAELRPLADLWQQV